jgi:5'(3')-deoxyribonucleotidase
MTGRILPLYNEKYNDSISIEQVVEYDMRPLLKPECVNPWAEFVDDAFYESLDVTPNAVEVLTELNKSGHDIYFATAGHPYTMRARDNWLEHFFPFYKTGSLISIREKQLLKVDFLVDDFEENLINGMYYGLLMDRPWNKDFPTRLYRTKRIFDITEVPKIIRDYEKGLF